MGLNEAQKQAAPQRQKLPLSACGKDLGREKGKQGGGGKRTGRMNTLGSGMEDVECMPKNKRDAELNNPSILLRPSGLLLRPSLSLLPSLPVTLGGLDL